MHDSMGTTAIANTMAWFTVESEPVCFQSRQGRHRIAHRFNGGSAMQTNSPSPVRDDTVFDIEHANELGRNPNASLMMLAPVS